MSFVSTNIPTSPSDNIQALLKRYQKPATTVDQTQGPTTTGAGITADVAHAPEAQKVLAITAMMASIGAFMPPASEEDVDVALASATAKLKKTMNATQASQIEINQETKREQADAAKKKYDDATKKIQDAQYKMAHASIWDKIKLAFEFIGAIAAIIAGIATMAIGIATGVGAPAAIVAGALLITSGLLMLTLAVDHTVAMATAGPNGQPGMGMFQRAFRAIAEDAGLDPNSGEGAKLVQWGSFAVSTAIMIAALVTGVVGGIVAPEAEVAEVTEAAETFEDTATTLEAVVDDTTQITSTVDDSVQTLSTMQGAGDDVGEMESAADDTLQTMSTMQDAGGDADEVESAGTSTTSDADDAASTGSSFAGKIKDYAGKVGEKILNEGKTSPRDAVKSFEHTQNFINSSVSTAGDVASSVYNYQAADDQHDAMNLKADAKKFEAAMKMMDEFIDLALGQMKKAGEQMNAVLDTVIDSKNDLNKSLTNFRFSA